MERFYLALTFLSLLENCTTYLNETEQKITLSVMNELKISHCVLVRKEENERLVDLLSFKSFASWNKALTYQNIDYLIELLRNESHPDQKTIIVFKVEKLSTVVEFLEKLYEIRQDHKIHIFTWLTFVDWSKSTEEDENNLIVPMSCQFFVVRYTENLGYRVVETYKAKNLTLRFDFGIWNKDSFVIDKYVWYYRRSDLKNITVPLTGRKSTEMFRECKRIRIQCSYFVFLEWLEAKMNFSFEHTKLSNNKTRLDVQRDLKEMDMMVADYPSELLLYSNENFRRISQISGPIFKQNLNWLIKKPESYKQSNYIEPFDTEVWISVSITILLSSTIVVTIQYTLQKFLIRSTFTRFVDTVFTPLDDFTNQEGATHSIEKTSSRITTFTIRFTALFLLEIYLASVTAFMALDVVQIPFKNAYQFWKNGEYQMKVKGTEVQARDFFETARDPVLQKIKEKLYNAEPTINEIINSLCTKKIAMASYESVINLKDIKWRCKIYLLQPPLQVSWNTLLMSKRSPFKKIFNYYLLEFYSSGIQQQAEKIFLNPEYYQSTEAEYYATEFKQIIQILVLLLSGAALSIIILIGEFGFRWTRSENKAFAKIIRNGTNFLYPKTRIA